MKRPVISLLTALSIILSVLLISGCEKGWFNKPPEWTKDLSFTVEEGQKLEINLNDYASDPNGDPLKFSIEDEPEFVSLDGATLTIAPTFTDAGTYTFAVYVTDEISDPVGATATVVVKNHNLPPVWEESSMDIEVLEGDLVKEELPVYDPDGDDFTVYMTPDSTVGTVVEESGKWYYEWQTTLEDEGEYTVKLYAVDSGGATSDMLTINITVRHSNATPTWSEIGLQEATENVETTLNLLDYATDLDDDTLKFSAALHSVDGETEEVGDYWIEDGVFHWIPSYDLASIESKIATVVFRMSVTDGFATSTTFVTYVVHNNNRPPMWIKPIEELKYDEGTFFEVSWEEAKKFLMEYATDLDNDDLDFQIVSYPSTIIEVNESSIIFNIGYDASGVYNVEIVVTDGEASDSTIAKLTVNNVPRAPKFVGLPSSTETQEGSEFVLDLTEYASDLDIDVGDEDWSDLKYDLVSVEPEATWMEVEDGKLIATPTFDASGEYLVTVKITDSFGMSGEGSFTLIVENYNHPPKVTLVSPTDGATDVSVFGVLEWNLEDEDGDTLEATLFIRREGEESWMEIPVGSDEEFYLGKLDEKLSYNQKYYWYVEVEDGEGGYDKSDTWYFVTTYKGTLKLVPSKYRVKPGEEFYVEVYADNFDDIWAFTLALKAWGPFEMVKAEANTSLSDTGLAIYVPLEDSTEIDMAFGEYKDLHETLLATFTFRVLEKINNPGRGWIYVDVDHTQFEEGSPSNPEERNYKSSAIPIDVVYENYAYFEVEDEGGDGSVDYNPWWGILTWNALKGDERWFAVRIEDFEGEAYSAYLNLDLPKCVSVESSEVLFGNPTWKGNELFVMLNGEKLEGDFFRFKLKAKSICTDYVRMDLELSDGEGNTFAVLRRNWLLVDVRGDAVLKYSAPEEVPYGEEATLVLMVDDLSDSASVAHLRIAGIPKDAVFEGKYEVMKEFWDEDGALNVFMYGDIREGTLATVTWEATESAEITIEAELSDFEGKDFFVSWLKDNKPSVDVVYGRAIGESLISEVGKEVTVTIALEDLMEGANSIELVFNDSEYLELLDVANRDEFGFAATDTVDGSPVAWVYFGDEKPSDIKLKVKLLKETEGYISWNFEARIAVDESEYDLVTKPLKIWITSNGE